MIQKKGLYRTVLLLLLTSGLVFANGEKQKVVGKHNNRVGQLSSQPQKLKLMIGDKTVVLPLIDSQTTREFVKLLPLTLEMSDINNREKYSGLPTKLSGVGPVNTRYKVGDLSYWLGGGIAAFYNQDEREVKAGLIVLAKLEKDVTLFNTVGPVIVTFELIKSE